MKEIFIRLEGGLGNQMFQFAFGLALSRANNSKLYIDKSSFEYKISKVTPRSYQLDAFKIDEFISFSDCIALRTNTIRLVKRFPILGEIFKLKIELGDFDVSALKKGLEYKYFSGYWQSSLYFSDYADEVFEFFANHKPFGASAGELLSIINSKPNSVMMHFRRGDYVSNPLASVNHGSISLNYYSEAIQIIKKRIDNPFLFIFSDDCDWVEKNFDHGGLDVLYVRNDGARRDWEDLVLMSYCKNQIIANSSFSWWSAWLSDKRFKDIDRYVVAPLNWFKSKPIVASERFPKSWIVI